MRLADHFQGNCENRRKHTKTQLAFLVLEVHLSKLPLAQNKREGEHTGVWQHKVWIKSGNFLNLT